MQEILRLPDCKRFSGYSRSTIYLRISQRLWTHPISLGPRAVGWPKSEIAAINAARIAGRSDDEIRALVAQLEAERTATHFALDPQRQATNDRHEARPWR